MFLPDVLSGRSVAVAGPAGPLAQAVADAAGRAGATVVLCGHDTDSLDELAWDLAERRDAPVEIVSWDGADPGAGLRAALEGAGCGGAGLVLLGGAGWNDGAARSWAGQGPVVVIAPPGDPAAAFPGPAAVLIAPPDAPEAHLAAWAVFLLSTPGRAAAGQVVGLRDGG